MRTQLEGQTERLPTRQTVSGAVVYTNRPTEQEPVAFDMADPIAIRPDSAIAILDSFVDTGPQATLFNTPLGNTAPDNPWADLLPPLDAVRTEAASPGSGARRKADLPKTREAVLAELGDHGLRVFPRKIGLARLRRSLKTEEKPELDDLSEISRAVASRLVISPTLKATAVKAAMNRIKQKELHKELTTGAEYSKDIQVVTDRTALAREAMAALRELPQAEEEDYRIIVQVIASRLREALDDALDNLPAEAQASEPERVRLARDAAHWVIRNTAQDLREDMFSEIAKQARLVDARPLPDVMVFPNELFLEPSAKNIYGVLPPTAEDTERIEQVLVLDDRAWLADRVFTLGDASEFVVGRYDGAVKLNGLERSFARALDSADFVVWWHRNPDKKAYAVRVVSGEHEHYFYPDFVVCLKHNTADKPMQRLLETKENTKDAARKSRHTPAGYGKVLFLTPDGNRMRWINDDGSLGEVVDLGDMQKVLDRFAVTRPVAMPEPSQEFGTRRSGLA